jgi:hypothetical protein
VKLLFYQCCQLSACVVKECSMWTCEKYAHIYFEAFICFADHEKEHIFLYGICFEVLSWERIHNIAFKNTICEDPNKLLFCIGWRERYTQNMVLNALIDMYTVNFGKLQYYNPSFMLSPTRFHHSVSTIIRTEYYICCLELL